jgi:hypothetical protein
MFKSNNAKLFNIKIYTIALAFRENFSTHYVMDIALTEQSKAVTTQFAQYERRSGAKNDDKPVSFPCQRWAQPHVAPRLRREECAPIGGSVMCVHESNCHIYLG